MATSDLMSQSTLPSLLSIPPEIRRRIWSFLAPEAEQNVCGCHHQCNQSREYGRDCARSKPAINAYILLVSRQINAEAKEHFNRRQWLTLSFCSEQCFDDFVQDATDSQRSKIAGVRIVSQKQQRIEDMFAVLQLARDYYSNVEYWHEEKGDHFVMNMSFGGWQPWHGNMFSLGLGGRAPDPSFDLEAMVAQMVPNIGNLNL